MALSSCSRGWNIRASGGTSGRCRYNKELGWQGGCHGHLNEDVINYVKTVVKIAESYDTKLQFFLQGNTFEDPVEQRHLLYLVCIRSITTRYKFVNRHFQSFHGQGE